MDNHPTEEELAGLVFGGNSDERTPCAGAVDRAAFAVQRTRTAEQKQQVLELLALGGLDALGDAPPDLQGFPVCEALLEWSWTLRYKNPEQMVQLAQAAVLVADRLTDADRGPEEIMDLRCRAWRDLGNALRVRDELDRAEEALGRAMELFLGGSQDEFLKARLFDVYASLYAARRSFELALAALEIVVDIYRRHGDQHLVGRALISKGIYTGDQGQTEEAVLLLQQGLDSVDEVRDPGLVFSALQCQAWLFVESGRFRDARLVIWELRRRRPDAGGHVNELKLRWLDARIFAGQGKLDRAERAFQQVKQEFEKEGLRYKAALVGLELGAVWLRQGRNAEAEGVVLESTEVFLSLRIEREVLASVLVLRRTAEKQRLTLSLLNLVIERLRQSDRD